MNLKNEIQTSFTTYFLRLFIDITYYHLLLAELMY